MIPCDYSIIEDIADKCEVKGWKEFSEPAKNACCIPENIISSPEGFDGESIQSMCTK